VDANIGVRTGPESGLLMVGPDGAKGKQDLGELEETNGWLPVTPTAASGSGGSHLIFSYPTDGKVKNRKNHLGTKIDVRGEGGYFIAAPSVNGAGPYEWIDSPDAVAVADPPAWLVEWCRKDEPKANQNPDSEPKPETNGKACHKFTWTVGPNIIDRARKYVATMDAAISGQRGHDRLYAVATVLIHGFALERTTAKAIILQDYNPRCKPPWSEEEIDHKLDDAAEKEHDKPKGWLRDAPLPNDKANGTATSPPGSSGGGQAEPTTGDETVPIHLTDTGNGLQYAADHVGAVLFVPAWGWCRYNGKRWLRDELGYAQELAKKTVREMYAWAAAGLDAVEKQMAQANDETKEKLAAAHAAAKKKMGWAYKSEEAKRINAMLALARTDPRIASSTERFDRDAFAFNVANGTIDLRTGSLRPHNRTDYITKLSNIEFDPKATAPT
jgi:putative DNA primase/helicase